MKAKNPPPGPTVRFHCASCDVWICSFYREPPPGGSVFPSIDSRLKNFRRADPTEAPTPDSGLVLTCPRQRCGRAHPLTGRNVKALYESAVARDTIHVHLRDGIPA